MSDFKTLAVMLDMSRNGVMTLDAMKNYLPLLAKMGYNCLFLYTEDTYEIEGEPYFGYFRGKYSVAEMKELNKFAKSIGIEVVPCIQTLAHLGALNKWKKFSMDMPDTLMVDDERTYALVEKMFATLSECFDSRRIHIGMDEAHMLGRGAHLDRYGYETNDVLMRRHLDKVCSIAKKYGYEPMMWSDMFFRGWGGDYFIGRKAEVPKEYIDALPESVTPVYWDYYSTDEKNYDDMFYNHAQLSDKTWFAGGIWTWAGFAPLNARSVAVSIPALNQAKAHGIENIMLTLWGDDGAECSRYAVLPALFYVAEYANGNTDEADIKKKFEEMFGIAYDDFALLDLPNEISNEGFPITVYNVCKYALFSDYFAGFLDAKVTEGEGKKYKKYAADLYAAKERAGEYAYLFDTCAKLCDILYDKYELGIKTRRAYKQNDKAELTRLANEEYAKIEENVREFLPIFRTQWMKENKPYGFEIHEYRLAGLAERTASCKARLLNYADGKLESIPELEEDILPFDGGARHVYFNKFAQTFTSNVF